MYAISRLQADSGTWYWAVHFTRAGILHYRRFYEPKYGGRLAARRAAIAWRDRRLAKVKALGIVEFADLHRSNNTSGVPGVTFSTPPRQPEGIWQARLKLAGGKTATKSFSVRLHGERRAFELAVRARQQMLADAQDRPFVHHPVARAVAAAQRRGQRA
ncbi:MAG: hypothetical protein HS128_02995 [Ideonella sp.]|nr:hypothetical protein [Ideonella sp.]